MSAGGIWPDSESAEQFSPERIIQVGAYFYMKYNLSIPSDCNDFNYKVDYLLKNKKIVDLKAVKVTRTTKQNSSLHKYFEFIANELNELGIEYQYKGITGNEFSLMYTPELVKEYVWRPIQLALFNIESTTKLDTKQMNSIIDVITKFFGDRCIVLPFPSIETIPS